MRLALLVLLCLFPLGSFIVRGAESPTVLSILPEKVSLKVGREASLRVHVRGATGLFSAPFYLVYDPRLIEITKMEEGGFLKKDRKRTAFLHKVNQEEGIVIAGLTRLGEVGGVNGEGTLLVMRIRALVAGKGRLSLQKIDLRDQDQRPIGVLKNDAHIHIQ